MSLRLFEEPLEATESPEPVYAPLANRIFFCIWASLVALIPALAAAYSSLQVVYLFRSLTNAEAVRNVNVLGSLHAFNTPLVLGLGIAALLAFVLALLIATDPKRRLASVGLPFSIGIPILAAAPAAFLWFAETTVSDIFSGKLTGTSPSVVAQTVSTLLFCALASGLLVQAATVICAIISLCIPTRSRTDALSLRRAFIWAVTGTLLLVFAVAYFIVV